jgi:hypothetical protein
MNTRTVLFVTVILLVILPAGNISKAAQKENRKFRVELYGGFAVIDPSDLNQQALYDKQYMTTSRAYKFSHLSAQYDRAYQYAGDLNGGFGKISTALPFGLRLKYNISKTIALSLGFQYMSRDRVSNVDSNYGVYWINPGGLSYIQEYADNLSYTDYTLSVKGYAPLLGIHFMTRRHKAVYMEAFVAGGPLFAECSRSTGSLRRVIYPDGYWWGYDYSLEMKGTGTGLALEAGVRLNFRVKKHFEIFVEGGYAYQAVQKISGSYADEYQQKDANAAADIVSWSWEGDWQMAQGGYEQYWANFSDVYPMVSWGDGFPYAGDFNLDLSGIRIKVGIAYVF